MSIPENHPSIGSGVGKINVPGSNPSNIMPNANPLISGANIYPNPNLYYSGSPLSSNPISLIREYPSNAPDPLAGFTRISDGLYINEALHAIRIRLVITYSDNDDLWNFYQNNREELADLIRTEVAKMSSELDLKEILVTRGSLIIILGAVFGGIAAYPAIKELIKDIQAYLPLLKRKIQKFFQNIKKGFKRMFGRGEDPQVQYQ